MPSSALKKKKKYKIYFFICFSFHLLYFSSLFIQIALVPTIFPYTTLFRSMVTLPAPPASWHVITTGDFNGDGHSDLLWQNDNGTPLIWTMNGANVVAGQALPVPPASWHIVTTGDFNGDGKADILWQNSDGTPLIWLMNGPNVVTGQALPTPPSSWHVITTGDFNGDGKADILWQNSDGTPLIWIMNGTTEVTGQALPNPNTIGGHAQAAGAIAVAGAAALS